MKRKGILLAGGKSSRLYPATRVICKQLLPIFDKPMIYYPLSTLMSAGIREHLIVCSPRDLLLLYQLLGDGSRWGISISYAEQDTPRGLADAFLQSEPFLQEHPCAVILGDNLFHGRNLPEQLRRAAAATDGAVVFACPVDNPQDYGVVDLDAQGKALHLEEKPREPRSKLAVTGLYFYDPHAMEYAKQLKPSGRGELEITDLNQRYLDDGRLSVERMETETCWFDTGTCHSLAQAQRFVQETEPAEGTKIGCPEEIAYRQGGS